MTKKCNVCLETKDIKEFDKKRAGAVAGYCSECRRRKLREHYQANKEYYVEKARRRTVAQTTENRKLLIAYLRDNPCVDCGNTDVEVLQFDHREPGEKLGVVGNFLRYSEKKMWEEVTKCEVRCANCHVKRTRRQLGWWTDDLINL